MFQLLQAEYDSLRSQFATLNVGRGKHRKYLPFVFTEQGASMVSAVLKSERAVEVNIAIMRAFVQFRRTYGNQGALGQRVERVEERLNEIEKQNTRQSQDIINAIQDLKSSMTELMTKASKTAPKGNPSELPQGQLEILLKEASVEFRASAIGKDQKTQIDGIYKSVAKYYGLEVQDLKTSSRLKTIVLPRQITMYLIRKLVGISFKDIGRCFSGKDHSTILHACRKIELTLVRDKVTRESVETILAELL